MSLDLYPHGRTVPTVAMVTRPLRGRALADVPFQRGGVNYRLLREFIGPRARPPAWNGRSFEFPRGAVFRVAQGLADHYNYPVELITHGNDLTTCVSACYEASPSPESVLACVCSCAGTNHGTFRPPADHVHVGSYPNVGDVYAGHRPAVGRYIVRPGH